jgi:hypothetical protein
MEADVTIDVSSERAQQIRMAVSQIKAATWVADLKVLVKELGREEIDEQDPLLNQGDGAPRVFEKVLGDQRILISLNGSDLFFSVNGKSVFELNFLPKGHEFTVSFVDEERMEQIDAYLLNLEEDLKKSKQAKAAKLSFLKK